MVKTHPRISYVVNRPITIFLRIGIWFLFFHRISFESSFLNDIFMGKIFDLYGELF